MTIIAAADGSALGNPGPAGWAWYVDETCWAAGGWPHATNNMAELMAVLDLLRQTERDARPLHVLCDSQYVINVITKWMTGWKRKDWRKADGKAVMNVELVQALDQAMEGRDVTFAWVRGHAGHELNEAADRLARAVATAYQQGKTPVTGPGFGAPRNLQGACPASVLDPDDPDLDDDEADLALAGDEPADPDPDDLFGATDIAGLDVDVTEREHVIELERSLLADAVRSDPSRVAALLHPEFREIGASGRLMERVDVLARIGPLDPPATLEILEVQRIEPDQLLLLWRSTWGDRIALRSSLWVQLSDETWQLRFHQGTPEA